MLKFSTHSLNLNYDFVQTQTIKVALKKLMKTDMNERNQVPTNMITYIKYMVDSRKMCCHYSNKINDFIALAVLSLIAYLILCVCECAHF